MFIELHIIQNFAPSCLNRDDTNAPKDCEFGGYRRARISSQCIKRSVRGYFQQNGKDLHIEDHLAERSRKFADEIAKHLEEKHGKDYSEALAVVKAAVELMGLAFSRNKKSSDEDEKQPNDKPRELLTEYLLFLDPKEKEALSKFCIDHWNDLKKDKPEKFAKEAKAVLAHPKSGCKAVDLALFGRMLANLPENNIDAACQVAHALSTHAVDMEMDFFTAVDDLQPKADTGAGMMGVVEFNSSCFYRYSLLDTEQLVKNLGGDKALSKSAALAYVKASIFAIPTGKQNSMAAQNLPVFVRVIVRNGDSPRSFANAFLSPARPSRDGGDLAEVSIKALGKHDQDLSGMYGKSGIKLDAAASTYKEQGADSVESLLKKLGDILP